MKDALGAVQSVLVLGGTSEIALATCRELARGRARTFLLAARKPETLDTAVAELRAAGATRVEALHFDATDFASHEQFVAAAFERAGDVDLVLVAFGVLGDQREAERDATAALEVVQTNFTGVVSVTVPLARRLQEQGHGTLVLLSSVAAERARRTNFVYGASKAGADAFYQGLADRLAGSGVDVLVVRPGFVHTRMTAGLPPAPLSVAPDAVARAVVSGLARGAHTVWVPGSLRPVMTVLRHLPRAVFRRLAV
jgi:decaprenylphospho-beta-D-erythro-pentofuranosid-2-ulose 2-reductase